MASALKKNWSLISTIAVILIVAVGGYYVINLKQGPYKSTDFVSVQYKWGIGDSLVNSYDSATGIYQYLDSKDSLITKKFKLHSNEMIFLHNKANELGLWNLPAVVANKGADLKSKKVLRYEMVFNYTSKTKKVIFMSDYTENTAVGTSANELQQLLRKTIDEAEDRYSSN